MQVAHPPKSDADADYLSYLLYRAWSPRDSAVPLSATPQSQQQQQLPTPISQEIPLPSPPATPKRNPRGGKKQLQSRQVKNQSMPVNTSTRVRQPYDALLVFDVEATCVPGRDFNWANEIIEWPVVLLRWKDKTPDGKASELYKVDEFRTYVKPTFRPALSEFCKSLTGIQQADVDSAPTFCEILPRFKEWLAKHYLIDPVTGQALQRFMFCTDGPYDMRDFVIKQCFISKVTMPSWLPREVMDVRKVVSNLLIAREAETTAGPRRKGLGHKAPGHVRRPSLNITYQLEALSLPPFEGRQHSGIDDSRNIARIVAELARLGSTLESNVSIDPGKRWYWMGARPGEIHEEYL